VPAKTKHRLHKYRMLAFSFYFDAFGQDFYSAKIIVP